MRLIDGDELLEHAYRDRLDTRERIADMIRSAPTVNYVVQKVPIRAKGKWINNPNMDSEICECSVCGYVADDYYSHFNFCFNCGADMRESEDKE